MIDYIHISVNETINTKYLIDTGAYDIRERKGRKYEYRLYDFLGMKICDYSHKALITGSLHKFYNQAFSGDSNNYTQFGFKQVKEAITLLSHIINIPPNRIILHGYEYALNLHTSFDPKEIILHNIICHRKQVLIHKDDYGAQGMFSKCKFTNYELKIYDKGKHQEQKTNILRIERKVIRSRLNRQHISHLHHLVDPGNWWRMKEQIIESARDLIILDQPSKYLHESNNLFWSRLREDARKKNDRRKFKSRFDKLPVSQIKTEILSLCDSTFKRLLCHEVTPRSADQLLFEVSQNHTIYIYVHL